MRAKWLPLALALLGTIPTALPGQVLVAPIQLFLGQRAPMGTFYVYNQSQQPQEISISFRFGYPVTDDNGVLRMLYGDSLPLSARSMQGWVRAFPKQFVLGPGQRQEVRITTRAPQGLAEGMYWTRIATVSSPQSPPVDTVAPGVNASITFRLEQVTTVLYARGSVSTGVGADTPRVQVDSSGVGVIAHLTPTGNAPFFGTGSVHIVSEAGTAVDSSAVRFAMYQPMALRYDVGRKPLPPGRYVAELRIASERDDIAPQDLLRIEPVIRKVPFTIP